jgi:hypothetical protein
VPAKEGAGLRIERRWPKMVMDRWARSGVVSRSQDGASLGCACFRISGRLVR